MADVWSDLVGTIKSVFRLGFGRAVIDATGLSSERTFTLPDKSGTISMLDDAGGITNDAPVGAVPVTIDGDGNLGASQITESGGRDNVPVLSGGTYNVDFYSSAQTGFELTGTQPAAGSYTPNGLLAVSSTPDVDVGVSGALVGVYDTCAVGGMAAISALNLDAIKVGNGDMPSYSGMVGLSAFIWNQGSGDIGRLSGIEVAVESDGGTVLDDVAAIRIGAPSLADVDGKSAALSILNQTANNAAGGAYAIYYDAPDTKTFAVKANGDVQIKGNVGFYGVDPVNRPEVPVIATVQDIVDALLALGLITQAS